MISVIVVDDEAAPRQELTSLIQEHDEFTIIGECKNAFEAMKVINNEHPDVVFLDIKMPEITGIEMLSLLDKNNLPRIVFVTAFGEYAVEAFRQNAVDYLLKPINKEDLAETLSRLIDNCQPQSVVPEKIISETEFIAVKFGKTDSKIRISDVIYASTKDSHGVVKVIVENREQQYSYLQTLDTLSQISTMKRCHGQNVINTDKIQRLEKKPNKNAGIIHTTSGHEIDIGKMFVKKFF